MLNYFRVAGCATARSGELVEFGARNGLAHVMTDLLPLLEVEQAAIAYCWLSKVLTIVDIARIDAEGSA